METHLKEKAKKSQISSDTLNIQKVQTSKENCDLWKNMGMI